MHEAVGGPSRADGGGFRFVEAGFRGGTPLLRGVTPGLTVAPGPAGAGGSL